MLAPDSPSASSSSSSSSTDSSKRAAFYTLARAEPADARRLVDIEFRAFAHEPANQLLSFRDYTEPAHVDRAVALYAAALGSSSSSSPLHPASVRSPAAKRAQASTRVSFLKVTDADARGAIVSFAKAEFKQYSLAELRSPADSGHEHEPRMNRDWFALNEGLRRAYVGLSKHCYIGMLATQPRHQHNGAGTLLLAALLAEADQAGMEVYLESTGTAKPLYERHGFVAVNEVRFEPGEYGVYDVGGERQTVMVRGALGRDGVRRGVRGWEAAVAGTEAAVRRAARGARR
ncbi:hypothetical protein LTR53_000343 [Teratosphaeriaceae sp. CCFEE 6253]|nr:hypothetical protein LTR53_000343 [Teratosphaeriaceae sp. CCFEE 6253]